MTEGFRYVPERWVQFTDNQTQRIGRFKMHKNARTFGLGEDGMIRCLNAKGELIQTVKPIWEPKEPPPSAA